MTDCWADWIRTRRTGGDAEFETRTLELVAGFRDRVLDNAGLATGETLLDVGCGNGLIGLGALERGAGDVVFVDISRALLDDCRRLTEEAGLLDRCRFVEAAAEDLSPVADESVDVVTTRSVLIYVDDKARAFGEFHRVLRPGGRVSIFEPINSFTYPEPPHLFGGSDVTAVTDLAEKVKAIYESRQPPDECPMLDFDERDLFDLAERAGFEDVHLSYEAQTIPGNLRDHTRDWETALRSAPNPLAPTLGEAMAEALTPDEAERFAAHLRPLVESGRRRSRDAVAYLWTVR